MPQTARIVQSVHNSTRPSAPSDKNLVLLTAKEADMISHFS